MHYRCNELIVENRNLKIKGSQAMANSISNLNSSASVPTIPPRRSEGMSLTTSNRSNSDNQSSHLHIHESILLTQSLNIQETPYNQNGSQSTTDKSNFDMLNITLNDITEMF